MLAINSNIDNWNQAATPEAASPGGSNWPIATPNKTTQQYKTQAAGDLQNLFSSQMVAMTIDYTSCGPRTTLCREPTASRGRADSRQGDPAQMAEKSGVMGFQCYTAHYSQTRRE